MKIPTNPGGLNPMPPEGRTQSGRGAGGPGKDFEAAPLSQPSGGAEGLQRVAPRSEWRRADVDRPQQFEAMLSDSVHQLVASSPLAGRFTSTQLAELEKHLTTDPVMRELLTQHLGKSLD